MRKQRTKKQKQKKEKNYEHINLIPIIHAENRNSFLCITKCDAKQQTTHTYKFLHPLQKQQQQRERERGRETKKFVNLIYHDFLVRWHKILSNDKIQKKRRR